MAAMALWAPAGPTSEANQILQLDARQWSLLQNSVVMGAGAAILASLLGAPVGLYVARGPARFRSVLRLALIAPLLLPPYVIALAWTYLGGTAGLVARAAGRDLVSGWTYSVAGAAVILGLIYYPIPMLACEMALRRIDPGLEEAALLIARPFRVLRAITLRLAAPSLVGSALVVFVLSISDFGVPALLRVRVFTTEVFTAFAALYDFGRATVLAMPLLIIVVAVALAATMLMGEQTVVGRRHSWKRSSPIPRRWRVLLRMLCGAALITALAMPLAVLVVEALAATSIWPTIAGSGAAMTNSLGLSAVSASVIVFVAVWLGYARARGSGATVRLADTTFLVAFAVPSTVVGVGLVLLWNRPGMLGAVYGTDGMVLLAHVSRFLPLAAVLAAAILRQVPLSHEEASAVSGAGWLRTMTRVVLPQAAWGLAAVWVVTFVLAFGELGTSVVVAPPGDSTLPIRIYTLIANTPSPHVAALALVQALVIFCPLAAVGAVLSLRRAT
jgi:iron(III) transport system permease protein